MNNTGIIVGTVAVLVIGGLIFYSVTNMSPASTVATSTSVIADSSTEVITDNQVRVVSAPVSITDASASPTETTAVVSGTVTPNGAPTSYWYEYGTTMDLGSKSQQQSVGSGYAEIAAPAYITGLSKNATYYFRLVASNSAGTSAGTQYSVQTSLNTTPLVGGIPVIRAFAANSVTPTTAALSGEVSPSSTPTKFWFEYGKSRNLGNTTPFSSIGSGNVSVPAGVVVSNLDPNATYYFRLNAQNQFGTVNSDVRSFKTTGPASNRNN